MRIELVASDYAGVEGVYLLAFMRHGEHTPYGTGRSSHAGAVHYLGYSEDIGRRLVEHAHGQGAKLPRAVVRAGWTLHLVRVWPGGSRELERRIKDGHNLARVCPWCAWQLAPSPVPALAPSLFPVAALAAVCPCSASPQVAQIRTA